MESEEYADFREFDELQLAAVFDDIEDESDEASSSSAATGSTASGPESLPTTTSATATKRTPRKKAIPRPKTSFTLEKATSASEEILSEVITQMDSNEMVNEETFEHAPAVKHVTSVCRAALRERTYGVTLWTQFTAILTLLWPSIRASERLSLGSQRRQAMQQSFHSFRNTPVFRQAISNLCDQLCGIANPPIFFLQMFGRMLFQNLTLRHEQIPPQDQPATIRKFDAIEENALRYTSGYMAKALPNKIAHMSSGKAQMQQVIDNMTKGSNKETRLSYTKEWVTSQTRGGLKIVNDLTYLFFPTVGN
ncbi:uncharacterized protein [Amphiura filiformis]|uniref:uncharacterized protein n=1 Tax=Amphiura filiformis TaxID=82378 RepID=UPI003B226F71